MPQYKIIDYTFTTAAELARAILEYSGVSYEDVRYDKDKAGDAEKGTQLFIYQANVVFHVSNTTTGCNIYVLQPIRKIKK